MTDQSPPPPPAPPAPFQLDPQAVVAELEAMPEARPYWQLAQERAARKALAQIVQDQEQELQELRNDKARRGRDDAATNGGPSA